MHSDSAIADVSPRLGSAWLREVWRRCLRGFRRALARGRSLTLLLVALLGLVRIWDPLPVEVVRLKTFDYMQHLLPADETPPLVPVIAIDEASLKQLGQWPWSRKLLSEMVTRLMQAGAVVVGFDIVFAEPDRMSPASLAREVAGIDPKTAAEIEKLPSNDRVFADTLGRSRVVLGRFAENKSGDAAASAVPPKGTLATSGPDPKPRMPSFRGFVTNLSEFEAAAPGIGFVSLQPELDNLVRRVPAVVRVGDAVLPTLSVEMLRLAMGQRQIIVKSDEAGINTVAIQAPEALRGKVPPIVIPVDEKGRMWLRALRYKPERYISAADFMAGRVDPARVRGRLVLVGAEAAGLQDLRSTSLETNLPGVEVHAHLIENALLGKHLLRPHYGIGLELVAFVLAGLLLVVLLPMLGARWTLFGLLAVAGAVAGGAYYLLRYQLLLVDPSYPLVSAAVIYTFLVYASYISEERQRLFIRNAFGQYLSPTLVEQLAEHPESLKLGGDTREMTFLFSDVRGFTTISEGYKSDPQGLTRLINQFLTPMTNLIMARQGTIDKYMGDCIMAFWNAPIDDAAHARHGCEAALAMMVELDDLNRRLAQAAAAEGRGFQPLRIGVGVNTGECVVGNMGSEQRFDYSVLGDAVNLASRLEGLSKVYGISIIVGEDTQAKVPGLAWLELDLIAVKGKAEAVRIYTLLGDEATAADEAFRRLSAKQAEMLAAYRSQDWDRTEALLDDLVGLDGELGDFRAAYRERIEHYHGNPPGPAWDFVFIADTK